MSAWIVYTVIALVFYFSTHKICIQLLSLLALSLAGSCLVPMKKFVPSWHAWVCIKPTHNSCFLQGNGSGSLLEFLIPHLLTFSHNHCSNIVSKWVWNTYLSSDFFIYTIYVYILFVDNTGGIERLESMLQHQQPLLQDMEGNKILDFFVILRGFIRQCNVTEWGDTVLSLKILRNFLPWESSENR